MEDLIKIGVIVWVGYLIYHNLNSNDRIASLEAKLKNVEKSVGGLISSDASDATAPPSSMPPTDAVVANISAKARQLGQEIMSSGAYNEYSMQETVEPSAIVVSQVKQRASMAKDILSV